MDSKDSSPKTVLPLVCLRNLPAIAPGPSSRAACGHCGDGLSAARVHFNFFKLNAFTFPKEILTLEMTFALMMMIMIAGH